MKYSEFQIGFWHPVGPHSGEAWTDIIKRKHREIEVNGWTLWSFQHRRVLDLWQHELCLANPDAVWVFCSVPNGIDPARGVRDPVGCRSYRFAAQGDWTAMPNNIEVPHHFRPGKAIASAFVVRRVIHPAEAFERPFVEFLLKGGQWSRQMVPTRGEYLIRPGGIRPMRKVSAVLELKQPYLAEVSAKEASQW